MHQSKKQVPRMASQLVAAAQVCGVTQPVRLSFLLLFASVAGCNETSKPVSDPPEETLTQCGLPPVGSPGVPRPSGAPGGLAVLNWAGFSGAATYTFDDANASQIAHYAELQALGVPFTFYLITGKAEASNPIWAQALADGHELGNHTKTHLAAATEADVDAATDFIQQKFGARAWTMAAPMGDSSYADVARTRFLINRGVSNAPIGPSDAFDPFNLPCYVPPANAPATAFNDQIESARSAGKWRVLLVHGFTEGSDGAYLPVDVAEFLASVEHAKSLGDVWIGTMVNVGAYWRGQKAFSAATVTALTDSTTWTWTLPQPFPPGKCLRVTVAGGTLEQAGRPLTWNEHGYYEIALDAGSVTLKP